MCKDGERHGESVMPKHTTQCPWLNLTNLGGLTRQSNEKADKQIKMVDVQFVDFPLW